MTPNNLTSLRDVHHSWLPVRQRRALVYESGLPSFPSIIVHCYIVRQRNTWHSAGTLNTVHCTTTHILKCTLPTLHTSMDTDYSPLCTWDTLHSAVDSLHIEHQALHPAHCVHCILINLHTKHYAPCRLYSVHSAYCKLHRLHNLRRSVLFNDKRKPAAIRNQTVSIPMNLVEKKKIWGRAIS